MSEPRKLLPSEVTEQGYYWTPEELVRVWIHSDGTTRGVEVFGDETSFPLNQFRWFYGPLTPPEIA